MQLLIVANFVYLAITGNQKKDCSGSFFFERTRDIRAMQPTIYVKLPLSNTMSLLSLADDIFELIAVHALKDTGDIKQWCIFVCACKRLWGLPLPLLASTCTLRYDRSTDGEPSCACERSTS